jgi:metal-sulfur cluster biosynthetic enzyme
MLPVRRRSGRRPEFLRRNDSHTVTPDPEAHAPCLQVRAQQLPALDVGNIRCRGERVTGGARVLPCGRAYPYGMAIDQNLGKVDEVMTALYDIHDPEIGMSIVDLDLIKAVEIGSDGVPTEIKMVLTTPFCPWAGELIQTVKTKTEEVVGPPVKVTLLAERWEPPPGLF